MAPKEGKFWNAQELIEQIPPASPGQPIHWVWLATGDYSGVNIVRIQPPQLPAPDLLHIHREHDETAYVMEGDTDFRLGGFTKRVKPGDIIHIPAGVPHGPVSGEKMIALSVYGPSFDPENPDREFVS